MDGGSHLKHNKKTLFSITRERDSRMTEDSPFQLFEFVIKLAQHLTIPSPKDRDADQILLECTCELFEERGSLEERWRLISQSRD